MRNNIKTFEKFSAEPILIPLSQYYKTLPKKEALLGLKVWDDNNEEWIFIKSVEDGLFCGCNEYDDYGHYYNISDLKIEIE
jgi:hypothetical protein